MRGIFVVPPTPPAVSTPATDAIDAAANRIAGKLSGAWTTRAGAARYLPDLLAEALRRGTGTDAGIVMPSFHGIQAPLDGVLAALGPGPVSELDLIRLAGAPGYDPVVVELRPGELERSASVHWAIADPSNAATDVLPWNWCRMPLAVSARRPSPASAAVMPAVVAHLAEWLGREIDAEPAGVDAVQALRALLETQPV